MRFEWSDGLNFASAASNQKQSALAVATNSRQSKDPKESIMKKTIKRVRPNVSAGAAAAQAKNHGSKSKTVRVSLQCPGGRESAHVDFPAHTFSRIETFCRQRRIGLATFFERALNRDLGTLPGGQLRRVRASALASKGGAL
jgi:hypothetical protein